MISCFQNTNQPLPSPPTPHPLHQVPPCDAGDVRAHVQYGAAIFTPLSYEGGGKSSATGAQCYFLILWQRRKWRALHTLTRASCAHALPPHSLQHFDTRMQLLPTHHCQLVREPGAARLLRASLVPHPSFPIKPLPPTARSFVWVYTCSSAALQPSQSNSPRPPHPLPPLHRHFPLSCLSSTPPPQLLTPTSIASEATVRFTGGWSAGLQTTRRAFWGCRCARRQPRRCIQFLCSHLAVCTGNAATPAILALGSCFCRRREGWEAFGRRRMCGCWGRQRGVRMQRFELNTEGDMRACACSGGLEVLAMTRCHHDLGCALQKKSADQCLLLCMQHLRAHVSPLLHFMPPPA